MSPSQSAQDPAYQEIIAHSQKCCERGHLWAIKGRRVTLMGRFLGPAPGRERHGSFAPDPTIAEPLPANAI